MNGPAIRRVAPRLPAIFPHPRSSTDNTALAHPHEKDHDPRMTVCDWVLSKVHGGEIVFGSPKFTEHICPE